MRRKEAQQESTLRASLDFKIRFSEIDAMRVVWHGAYAKYFEDAREFFGKKFDLGYELIETNGFFAPIVELNFQYKQPLRYGMTPMIDIIYRPTEAAKIVFDYEIRDLVNGEIMVTGHSVQVFMDKDYQLVWESPEFYQNWKKRWNI
ncbi:MAG: acyl-CoA thioesterase [Prevotella sp.]|nr:acyl-CoA thioesterase [Prevotella sp.]